MNDTAFWKLDTLSDRQLLDGLGAVLGSGRRLTAELVAHLGEVERRRLHAPPATIRSARPTPVPEARLSAGDVTTLTSQPAVASRSPTSGFRAGRIEPLAAQRYKVQFTADTELKGKLELARDPLRHALPSGDFAPIILRALDLLIEDLMKRRFGAGARRKSPSTAVLSVGSNPSSTAMLSDTAVLSDTAKPADPAVLSDTVTPCDTEIPQIRRLRTRYSHHIRQESRLPKSAQIRKTPALARVPRSRQTMTGATLLESGDVGTIPSESDDAGTTRAENGDAETTPSNIARCASQPATSRYVRRAARRSVLERNGLRCSWVGAGGARCDGRAWLEHDHRQPRGKGGDSEPENLRLLCRAHNRFAAEREYGRQYIDRAVAQRRWERAQPAQRPPAS